MRMAQLRGKVKPFSPQFLNLVQYLGHWASKTLPSGSGSAVPDSRR
jgi:hypothetical protein